MAQELKSNPTVDKWLNDSRGSFLKELKALKECDSLINSKRVQDKLVYMAKAHKQKAIRYEASKICQKYKLLYNGKPIIPKSTKDNPIQDYISLIAATANYYKKREEKITIETFIEKFKAMYSNPFCYLEFKYGDELTNWIKTQITHIPICKDVIILDDESAV